MCVLRNIAKYGSCCWWPWRQGICNNHECQECSDVTSVTLQWRHNERDSVSNHHPHDCLLNRSFRRRSKKHQSSASLALVRGIHRWSVNSPYKGPVTRKMFPFNDVIMNESNSMSATRIFDDLFALRFNQTTDWPVKIDFSNPLTTMEINMVSVIVSAVNRARL